jgi:hypothetical protein
MAGPDPEKIKKVHKLLAGLQVTEEYLVQYPQLHEKVARLLGLSKEGEAPPKAQA